MYAKDRIEHPGEVIEIVGNRVDVSFVTQDACAGCKARKACGLDGPDKKIVSIVVDDVSIYEVGQNVTISVERSMGVKAVFLAYVVPLIILLATLLVLTSVEVGEVVAGLSAIGAAALYYIILARFRDRIDKEIIFKIV